MYNNINYIWRLNQDKKGVLAMESVVSLKCYLYIFVSYMLYFLSIHRSSPQQFMVTGDINWRIIRNNTLPGLIPSPSTLRNHAFRLLTAF